MYQCGGGGIGDGDLLLMLKDEEERPSSGAITRMCRRIGIEEDYRRIINNDDAWDYFYELLEKLSATMTREQLYESLASYLLPAQIEEHLNYINQHKRKTA
jgi:hypothetical protein